MEKIEDRISVLGVVLISGRSIDSHSALHAEPRAVIPDLGDSSVRYFIDTVQITSATLDNKDIGNRIHIPVHIYIGRVLYLKSVHDK